MVDAPFNQVGLDQHAHSGDMIKANLCWHSTVCARCGQDQHGIAFRSLGGVSCSAALCRWLMYTQPPPPPPGPHCPPGCYSCSCTEIIPQLNVTRVHYVTMHHFDLGWDDTIAIVLQMYLNESGIFEWRDNYSPGHHTAHPTGLLDRTLDAIDALRERGGPERLVFTTWSYLISMYIDCPPRAGFPCPSVGRVKCVYTCHIFFRPVAALCLCVAQFAH